MQATLYIRECEYFDCNIEGDYCILFILRTKLSLIYGYNKYYIHLIIELTICFIQLLQIRSYFKVYQSLQFRLFHTNLI